MTTLTPQSDDIHPTPLDFETFYRATGERTFRIARRMARGDRQVARDATQDAYEQLLRTWSGRELRSTEENTRYVAGIAVRRVAESYDPEPDGENGAGYDEALDRPLLESARALIDRQPTGRRAVAIMFFLEECAYPEIAEILDLPDSTIRTHVERMRVLMKPLVDGGGSGSIRGLVRRAHAADAGHTPFDVETGLAEVLARLRRPDQHWTRLAGRERQTACLLAARDGDRAAFAALVKDLTPLVWHVARSNGLGRAEAEDVVQTVWLALVRHVERLADPRALAAWLITTTRREASHLRRQAGRAQYVELADAETEELPATGPSPEDVVLREDRDRALWAAFQRLTPRCQELLRLTVLAGRAEYRAVAEALGIPVGSIGPTRGRCLKTLHGLYEQETGT